MQRSLALSVLSVLLASSAHAQINSLPPPLMGQQSYHLYTVPGVINGGGLTTFFACTNSTSANIRVGVQTFDSVGNLTNDASSTSLDILPSGNGRFVTSGAFGFGFSSIVGGGPLNTGSARILATQKKGIICTAFLADTTSAPPTSMVSLTIIKGLKQKAEN